jgi:hypothetical protein
LYLKTLPDTDISATSSRALHTGVAVPSSQRASKAAKNEVTDFLQLQKISIRSNTTMILLFLSKNFNFIILTTKMKVKLPSLLK